MLNIQATLNGEDFKDITIPKDTYTYANLKEVLKGEFSLSIDNEIEIYDNDNVEIKHMSTIPPNSKKFKVALLNKRKAIPSLPNAPPIPIEEDKGLENVLVDEISRNKYSCHYHSCRKTFKSAGKLFNHIKIHFKSKPYKCLVEDCGKAFLCRGQLRNHESTHTDQKRFTCKHPGCDHSYSKKSRLVVHERSHTGERPFKCPYDECGKSFSEKGNLKTHIRTHTGEKPYFCTVKDCGKRFTTQGHLVDHERRHKNEKPYKCEICHKAFMRSSTVKVHMKTHGEDVSSQSSRIKVSRPIEHKGVEEEKIILKEEVKEFTKPLPAIIRSQNVSKPETVRKSEGFVGQTPYKRLNSLSLGHNDSYLMRKPAEKHMPIPRMIERPIPMNMNNAYSLIATITSSRDNLFDSACNRATQRPMKKIGVMLPSINRFNTKEGCLLNKPQSQTGERCLDQTMMALNHLSARIMEDDPLV